MAIATLFERLISPHGPAKEAAKVINDLLATKHSNSTDPQQPLMTQFIMADLLISPENSSGNNAVATTTHYRTQRLAYEKNEKLIAVIPQIAPGHPDYQQLALDNSKYIAKIIEDIKQKDPKNFRRHTTDLINYLIYKDKEAYDAKGRPSDQNKIYNLAKSIQKKESSEKALEELNARRAELENKPSDDNTEEDKNELQKISTEIAKHEAIFKKATKEIGENPEKKLKQAYKDLNTNYQNSIIAKLKAISSELGDNADKSWLKNLNAFANPSKGVLGTIMTYDRVALQKLESYIRAKPKFLAQEQNGLEILQQNRARLADYTKSDVYQKNRATQLMPLQSQLDELKTELNNTGHTGEGLAWREKLNQLEEKKQNATTESEKTTCSQEIETHHAQADAFQNLDATKRHELDQKYQQYLSTKGKIKALEANEELAQYDDAIAKQQTLVNYLADEKAENPIKAAELAQTAAAANAKVEDYQQKNTLPVTTNLNALFSQLAAHDTNKGDYRLPVIQAEEFKFKASNTSNAFFALPKMAENINELLAELDQLRTDAQAGIGNKALYDKTDAKLQVAVRDAAKKIHKLNLVAKDLVAHNDTYREEFMNKLRTLSNIYHVQFTKEELGHIRPLAPIPKPTETFAQTQSRLQQKVGKIEFHSFLPIISHSTAHNAFRGTHKTEFVDIPPVTKEEVLHIMADIINGDDKEAQQILNQHGITSIGAKDTGKSLRLDFTTDAKDNHNRPGNVAAAEQALAKLLAKRAQAVYDKKMNDTPEKGDVSTSLPVPGATESVANTPRPG